MDGVGETNRRSAFFALSRRNPVWILAFSWILSISAGFLIGIFLRDRNLDDLTLTEHRISLFKQIGLTVFPIMVSAAAFYLNVKSFVYPVAVVRGICFGYTAMVLIRAYGSCSWLVCFLLSFANCITQVPLILFWIHHLDGSKRYLFRNSIFCLLVAVFSTIIDNFLISSFCIGLI